MPVQDLPYSSSTPDLSLSPRNPCPQPPDSTPSPVFDDKTDILVSLLIGPVAALPQFPSGSRRTVGAVPLRAATAVKRRYASIRSRADVREDDAAERRATK